MRDFRVLIVDDNEDAADSMAAFHQCYGFDVQVAYSGPTAITTALADPPDAILCDIGLPGLDGYAVASRLSAELPQRPLLVAITARPEQQVVARGAPAGFDYYFLKPAEPVEVGALLSDYAVRKPNKAMGVHPTALTHSLQTVTGPTPDLVDCQARPDPLCRSYPQLLEVIPAQAANGSLTGETVYELFAG